MLDIRQDSGQPRRRGLPTGADAPEAENWHLVDALRLLHKRRWSALSVFSLVMAAVAVYVWTATPLFEARVQVLIERDQPQIVVFGSSAEPQADSTEEYHDTQLRILQSRSLARATIDTLGLWDSQDLVGPPPQGVAKWFSTVGAGLSKILPAALRPDEPKEVEQPGVDEPLAQAAVVDAFLRHVTVTPLGSSFLFDVKFRSSNPELAASVANALVKQYIDQDARFKFERSKEASDWLDKQLEAQRLRVEASDAALQRYRDRTDAISTTQREVLGSQNMSEMNAALIRARTDRIQKEALYREAAALQNDRNALETFPAILSNSYVQLLRVQLVDLDRQRGELTSRGLGARHPQVLKVAGAIKAAEERLRIETVKALDAIKRDYLAALAQEVSLAGAFEAQQRDTVQAQRKESEYQSLERAASTDRQIFASLLQRAREQGVSGDQIGGHIRVVDSADVPRVAVSPQKVRSLSVAAVSGLMLAVGLAFFFEYFDNRLKTPDDIKAHLGLPCLGLVPLLAGHVKQGEAPMIGRDVPPNFSEALRIVRMNVFFSDASQRTRTMAITSTGPGEGKTIVAVNLAIGLALTGERVLLIDADMRRPKVHRLFVEQQAPGLSDVQAGHRTMRAALRATAVPGLSIMSCGTDTDSPTEVLSSAAFGRLLDAAVTDFDWVLIDTPPVLAVADASIVANRVDGVLFVAAAELTARRTAQAAIEQLGAANANIVGVVLNRVNLKRNSFYYFDYYRPEYERYYVPAARG